MTTETGTFTPIDHVGWIKHNGAGEVIFRQAVHPANEEGLPAQGWTKVYGPSAIERERRAAYFVGWADGFGEGKATGMHTPLTGLTHE